MGINRIKNGCKVIYSGDFGYQKRWQNVRALPNLFARPLTATISILLIFSFFSNLIVKSYIALAHSFLHVNGSLSQISLKCENFQFPLQLSWKPFIVFSTFWSLNQQIGGIHCLTRISIIIKKIKTIRIIDIIINNWKPNIYIFNHTFL